MQDFHFRQQTRRFAGKRDNLATEELLVRITVLPAQIAGLFSKLFAGFFDRRPIISLALSGSFDHIQGFKVAIYQCLSRFGVFIQPDGVQPRVSITMG